MKKKESLKAAEGKVTRLKEQLLASEKIVSANRVLLKKLQEQVSRAESWVFTVLVGLSSSCYVSFLMKCHFFELNLLRDLAAVSVCCVGLQVQRVQHRVSVKKQQSVRLERDLSQAQAAAAPAALKRGSSAAIYSVRSHG